MGKQVFVEPLKPAQTQEQAQPQAPQQPTASASDNKPISTKSMIRMMLLLLAAKNRREHDENEGK